MSNYNLGNTEIEFKTNDLFLLVQLLTRIDSVENKILNKNTENRELLGEISEFKKLLSDKKQGLDVFNKTLQGFYEREDWRKYSEFIESFASLDLEDLQKSNPDLANAFSELMKSDFFKKVKSLNDDYTEKMEKRFIKQTKSQQETTENIVGKTDIKKINYMPFTPEIFEIEPCCFENKGNTSMVMFSIPLDERSFEKSFGMKYQNGIESVILFHEKLHGHLPTKDDSYFQNHMQREIDSHLKRSIIELLANGEFGVKVANLKGYFNTTMHIGKIQDENGETLKTNRLYLYGIKDNELLHTVTSEKQFSGSIDHFSKDEMGIIKIRGMMYPYSLMYKNRKNQNQLSDTIQEMKRDQKIVERIYGEDFFKKISNEGFLSQIQEQVRQYDSLVSFAEGMSKELLGIEQTKVKNILFTEKETGKATVRIKAEKKQEADERVQYEVQEQKRNENNIYHI